MQRLYGGVNKCVGMGGGVEMQNIYPCTSLKVVKNRFLHDINLIIGQDKLLIVFTVHCRITFLFVFREKIADANLIAKWKKQGYENLCCLRCIQVCCNFYCNCTFQSCLHRVLADYHSHSKPPLELYYFSQLLFVFVFLFELRI